MKFIVALLLLIAALPALGQTPPSLSFSAATTTGNGSVVPVLAWSTVPVAASCTATGDAAWAGAKAASGSQTLPATTSSKTYNLSCIWPAGNSLTVSWTPPTTNTDGSVLTDLKGFKLYAGTVNPPTSMVKDVASAGTTSYMISPLNAGTWYVAATAYNALGAESALSTVVSKTLTGASVSKSVGITVNPVPMPPTALTVE